MSLPITWAVISAERGQLRLIAFVSVFKKEISMFFTALWGKKKKAPWNGMQVFSFLHTYDVLPY